jgi:hypothetical protein
MKPQKHAATRQVSARPRSLRDETLDDAAEEGLSIEPEQMGRSFLRYATQQGQPGAEVVPELHADGAPPSDDSADASHFSSDASIWENTAGMLMEHGGTDDLNEQLLPPRIGEEHEGEEEVQRGVAEVDLTASVIEEASLLDEESTVLGETIPKQPRTDDTGPASRRAQEEEDD